LRQVIQRQNWQLSESEYIEIVTDKTAALFSCCCDLGGVLAGAGETQLEALAEFGLNTGIAFQITDDLLDIIGNEKMTDKTLGSDVDKSKPTLAVIHLLKAMDQGEKRLVESKLMWAPDRREELVELLRSYGSLEYARSRAQECVAKATACLAGLEESSAKEALIETAEYVGQRAI
jgi:geranylgeranyl pyrophosphate synthase